jgi:hypothetical protein
MMVDFQQVTQRYIPEDIPLQTVFWLYPFKAMEAVASFVVQDGLVLNQISLLFFFNSNSWGWSPTGSTRHVGHHLAYCTCPGWLWGWRIWWNDDWQGKPKH